MGFSLPHHKLFAESHVALNEVVHVVDIGTQQQRALHAPTDVKKFSTAGDL